MKNFMVYSYENEFNFIVDEKNGPNLRMKR